MAEDWKCGAARDLPIQDGDPAWDGPAAEQAIFEWAGGDDFDPARARRAFLAYDANAPKLRGSYKLPFASVVDGDLKVPKAGIRAAASRLPQADLPQEVKDSADAVLEGYKKKAKMGDYAEEGDGRSRQRRRRPARARGPVLKARGMYGIAHLAYCINEVAESKEMAELESAMEGDESKVPMLLHNAIQALGVALQAMTEEEIAELLENDDVDVAEDDDGLDDGEVRQIAKAGTELAKRFLRAKYRGRHAMMAARAGKALSSANADLIGQAEGHHTKALEHHRVASEAHGNVGDAHQGLVDAHAKMRSAHDAMGAELEKDVPDQQVLRGHHRTIGRHLDGADGHMMTATDEHEAVGDSQRACARSVRAASRCLRAVDGYDGEEGGEGAMPGAQNSGGVTEGTSRNSADPDFRRRQAVKLKLAAG